MEDKVNSGIGLLYRQARLPYMAGGPEQQPFAGVNFIPQSGIYEFGYRLNKEVEETPRRNAPVRLKAEHHRCMRLTNNRI
jgi:hypothetical protein